MDSVTTTKRPRTLHAAGRRGSSRVPDRVRATVLSANRPAATAVGVMLAAEDSEGPRSWDELASNLGAMRADHKCAIRRARGLEDSLLREATWNG